MASSAGTPQSVVDPSVRFDNNVAGRISTWKILSEKSSMKHSIIKTALIALTLWMSAGLSLAADEPQPQKAKQTSAANQANGAATKSKAAPPKVELVDINSATKEELKKLPGIGDADADKIIAGRPYLSKAHLQTRNIVSPGVYQALRQLVVAKQKDSKFAKDGKK
jgi:competence protein ComEA